jgi:hypothetical protein
VTSDRTLGFDLAGSLAALRRAVATALGRPGEGDDEARADLRAALALLSERPLPQPAEDRGGAGLRAEIGELRRVADRLDLLADRVHSRAAALRGTGRPDPDRPVEERLRTVELLLDEADPGPAPAAAGSAAPARDRVSPTAEHLMRLVDRLGGALAARDDPDPLLGWLHRQLVEALGTEGISLIQEDGRFDPDRHEVIDTRPATRPDQADRISGTVRPGFRLGPQVIRPQQVVVWAAGEEQLR